MEDDAAPFDRLVDTDYAARLLGISPSTLRKARVYGGPNAVRYVKLGRKVAYSMRDLAQHVRLNTISRTCQHPGA